MSGMESKGDFRERLLLLAMKWQARINAQTMDQSKEKDKNPSPSLAIEPPKSVVTKELSLMLRQNIETPAVRGTVVVSFASTNA